MRRTISIKINPPKGFLSFMEICSEIGNRYIEWSFSNKTYSKKKAHDELYFFLRKEYPKIPSCLIQTIRDASLESVKSTKFKHKPIIKSHSAIRYDLRTMSLKKEILAYSFLLSGKRIKQKIKIPSYFKRYIDWKFKGGTISYNHCQKQFYANLCFEIKTPKKILSDKVLGIDRGLYNIISCSNGLIIDSKEIRKQKRKHNYLRKKLQTKGTRSAKRLLKKRSRKEMRFSLNQNHIISKKIVSMNYDIFVLEDLSGIRKQRKGKKINSWLSNWTFYQLESLIKYKAEELGKSVVKVNPAYTSQQCSNCDIIDKTNRVKSKYHCKDCGYRDHADLNAAKNIMKKYLLSTIQLESVEQVVVNQPYVNCTNNTELQALSFS